MNKNKIQLASIVSIAVLSLGTLQMAKSAEPVVVEETSIMTACKLFEIDSNAGLITAGQRVQIIQKRLDEALVKATDISPAAVKVSVENNNPIVTLDNYLIATADGNSATRNSTSRMQLAEKWADSLRMCLADSAAIRRYISMLTGKFPTVANTGGVLMPDEIAVLTPATLLPLKLVTPFSAANSQVGDAVEAVISTDVPLGPFFETYLPAGTVALGEVVGAGAYIRNHYAGKDAISINFYKLRTPNGEEFPVQGHILGGLNNFTMYHARPVSAVSCLNGPENAMAIDPISSMHAMASKGYIVGAWKGMSLDELSEDNHPRFLVSRESDVNVKTGEPMLLRLTASTALTIAGKRQFMTVLSAAN